MLKSRVAVSGRTAETVKAPGWADVKVARATPAASVTLEGDPSVPPVVVQNTVAPVTGLPGRSVTRTWIVTGIPVATSLVVEVTGIRYDGLPTTVTTWSESAPSPDTMESVFSWLAV